MAAAEVVELKRMLERRFPDAVPVTHRTAGAVATGIAELDALLPAGGLPRGRLTAWAPGGGATALLRAACEAVVGRGERAAWVDGAGVVMGDGWRRGPLLVRPRERREALACAEELVRSGGFGLVVLADAVPVARWGGSGSGPRGRGPGRVTSGRRTDRMRSGLADAEAARCVRGAREGGAAFVWLGRGRASGAMLRLASGISPDGYEWRPGPFGEPAEVRGVRARVRVEGMGWNREAEVSLRMAQYHVRMSLEPGLVDRRGARR